MKKTLTAVVVLCCSVAFAQAAKTTATPMAKPDTKAGEMKNTDAKTAEMAQQGGMQMPKMSMPKHEDKKGLDDFFKASDDAMMKGDMAACANMMAFPVYMVTDNSKGEGMTMTATQEQWTKMMGDAMKGMDPKTMKMSHKRSYTFLSDNLAFVTEENSMTHGKDNMKWRSGDLMMKKDGKWMITMQVEGGWGDTMGNKGTGGAGVQH